MNHPQTSAKKDVDIFTKIFGEIVSLTLPQVAASTPKEHNVKIIDENYEKLDFNNNVDLVGITCLTMCAPRAYEIADKYQINGHPCYSRWKSSYVFARKSKKTCRLFNIILY